MDLEESKQQSPFRKDVFPPSDKHRADCLHSTINQDCAELGINKSMHDVWVEANCWPEIVLLRHYIQEEIDFVQFHAHAVKIVKDHQIGGKRIRIEFS